MHKSQFLWVVLFCFAGTAAWSQTATTPASPAATAPATSTAMPTDPAELMKLAADVNGLASDKLAPWHLKATFRLYDFKGKPTEKGTYEEFWVTPKKYKVIFTSPSFNQTEWGTEDGGFFLPVGSRDNSSLRSLIRSRLLNPFEFVEKGTLTSHHETLGNVNLNCVSVMPVPTKRTTIELLPSGTYCFSQNEPILRTVSVCRDQEYFKPDHSLSESLSAQVSAGDRLRQASSRSSDRIACQPRLDRLSGVHATRRR